MNPWGSPMVGAMPNLAAKRTILDGVGGTRAVELREPQHDTGAPGTGEPFDVRLRLERALGDCIRLRLDPLVDPLVTPVWVDESDRLLQEMSGVGSESS